MLQQTNSARSHRLSRLELPRSEAHSKNNTKEQHQRKYKHHSYHHLYGHKWRQARLVFLKQHPLCVECQKKGRVTAANVVDHIERHEGSLDKFWNSDNWQALCKPCHDRKTAYEVGFAKT